MHHTAFARATRHLCLNTLLTRARVWRPALAIDTTIFTHLIATLGASADLLRYW